MRKDKLVDRALEILIYAYVRSTSSKGSPYPPHSCRITATVKNVALSQHPAFFSRHDPNHTRRRASTTQRYNTIIIPYKRYHGRQPHSTFERKKTELVSVPLSMFKAKKDLLNLSTKPDLRPLRFR